MPLSDMGRELLEARLMQRFYRLHESAPDRERAVRAASSHAVHDTDIWAAEMEAFGQAAFDCHLETFETEDAPITEQDAHEILQKIDEVLRGRVSSGVNELKRKAQITGDSRHIRFGPLLERKRGDLLTRFGADLKVRRLQRQLNETRIPRDSAQGRQGTPPVAPQGSLPAPVGSAASDVADDPAPSVFVSYSHDSAEHKLWVLQLATRLRQAHVDARLDQWDLHLGGDVATFMESLSDADRVLVICTPTYCRKADAGVGGVGYEKTIIAAEIIKNVQTTKFIPVIRQGDGTALMPRCLGERKFVDFRDDTLFEAKLEELLRALHQRPEHEKPPLGPNPFAGQAPHAPPQPQARVPEEHPLHAAGLTPADATVLTLLGKAALAGQSRLLHVPDLVDSASRKGLAEPDVDEALEILQHRGLVGGRYPDIDLTHYGFDVFLKACLPDYARIYEAICRAVVTQGLRTNDEITTAVNAPRVVVDHVLDSLKDQGLVTAQGFIGGHKKIYSVSAELRRRFRE